MKKVLLWGSAILCCAMTFVGISCSDSDSESGKLNVDETYLSKGIVVDENGQIVQIPLTCDGDWTASVPEDCDWVNVIVSKGKGNDKVVLAVDAQYEEIARNTTLSVLSGDKKVDIKIQQTVSGENDGEYKHYSSKGLGCGFNPNTFQKTTSSVLNFRGIEALAKADPLNFGDVYYVGDVNELNAGISTSDSIEHKYDSLCVKLTLEISYSNFKFGMSGAIDSHENKIDSVSKSHFGATYPMYQGNVQYADLASAYRDWVDEGKPQQTEAGTPDYRASILSGNFGKLVTQLDELSQTATSYKGNTAITNCCKKIVGTYSPLILTDVILGGAYCVELEADSAFTDQLFKVTEGKVSVSFSAGLFKIEGGVTVDYLKDAKEWLDHSNYKVLIQGGDKEKRNNLYEQFIKNALGTQAYDNALKEWSNSLKIDGETGKGNVELVRYSVVPIWLFFSDDAQGILREYIMDQDAYKDNELVIANDF